ncbi:hypothetical protein [Synechococcus sp. UW179B]|uniref:hypothetical protein n=1 Tax=Synechococcus sp. UW179B TaxID=2575516 RepID=UPI000E0E3D40|nr:hypothetical protein [Synechococcus sp. UW179B]
MLSLRAFPAVLDLGLSLAACQSVEKKAETDQVKVLSDSALVCSATAEVEKAMEQVNHLTPASTVADAEAAGASLQKALAKLDEAEAELQTSQWKEYRDQVAIYEKFVGQVRQNKTMTLEEAAKQLKAKAAPVIAAHEQLAETTVCIEVEEPTDSSDDRSRDTSKDDGPEKADS